MSEQSFEYGEETVEDKSVDCGHNVNTSELPELFDGESVDDFIANLNDWD